MSETINILNNTNNQLNSNIINIENIPKLPPIRYYNDSESGVNIKTGVNYNSYEQLQQNLTNSCSYTTNPTSATTKITPNGLFQNVPTNCYDNVGNSIDCNIPKNANKMDIPYYLALNGTLNIQTIENNMITDSDNATIKNKLINQIRYLACQLTSARNRKYNAADFIVTGGNTIASVFDSLGPSFRLPLILLFLITMYYLISGFFSSFDVTANVINIIQKNSSSSVPYWLGLLIGISIPIIVISNQYNSITTSNLSEIEKYNITSNSKGVENSISETAKNIDYGTLTLFILLIYGFVGVLFTIKKSSFNNYIYTTLITVILLIIALLIYVLYSYIPYYNTTDDSNIMSISSPPLKLFIDIPQEGQNNDISQITSNQKQNTKTRLIYATTAIIIFILTIFYFTINSYLKTTNDEYGVSLFIKSLFKGFLGSFAILIIPMLWVINFVIGLSYFPVYVIFLIFLRFIRYIGSTILYLYTKNKSKANYSDDLIKELDNFKNYTPSWGLVGVEELKTILAMNGYENLFSKSFISENNNSSDLSNNKFISSGLLSFMVEKNYGGSILSIIYAVLTIVISSIILFGVLKV